MLFGIKTKAERERELRSIFFHHFGFSFNTVAIQQPMVDAFLRIRAKAFNAACEEQKAFMVEDLSSFEKEELVANHARALEDVGSVVKRKKEKFWMPHRAAKNLGFEVKPSVADYLDNGQVAAK